MKTNRKTRPGNSLGLQNARKGMRQPLEDGSAANKGAERIRVMAPADETSAYAALISNLSAKDRAKDVEQFNDILRTFINDTKQVRGQIRHDQKMRKRCLQSRS